MGLYDFMKINRENKISLHCRFKKDNRRIESREQIARCSEYNYFGVTIHKNDKNTKDTRNRTAKRKIAIKRMNGI